MIRLQRELAAIFFSIAICRRIPFLILFAECGIQLNFD